jgi:glycosyltransferase involved in cell wall biosynthesis
MKISIAMTAFNGASYIIDQLNSFASQTRLPDEVVVCDDCSSDATAEILEIFSSALPFPMIVVRNELNLGYIKNFEKAISLCTGDLIFLSDQDDVWYKDKIERMLTIKNSRPNINVLICDAMYADKNLNSAGITVLQKVLMFSGRKNDHIAGACTAMTKEFRDFLLPFPENNLPAHDVYIHRWANLLDCKFVVTEVLQKWRIHDNNNSVSEMNNLDTISNIELYRKYKKLDSSLAYSKKATELHQMDLMVSTRKDSLLSLVSQLNKQQIRVKIGYAIDANVRRMQICQASRVNRIWLIVLMAVRGQYKYFQGTRSAVKDILR